MSDLREMFCESARRIFSVHSQAAHDGSWPRELWQALEEAGFTQALMHEDDGGAGLSWADTFSLLMVAGEYAAPVPLAESMIVNWLLSRAGVDTPEGVISLAPVVVTDMPMLTRSVSGWTLDGMLRRVPWGRTCGHVAVICDSASESANPPVAPVARVALVACDAAGVTCSQSTNLAGEPRDTFTLHGVTPIAVVESPISRMDCIAIGATARSALIAGALTKILALSTEYANLRVQFGRPIAKFQAVQHSLAILATQAIAATAASECGAEAIDEHFVAGGDAVGTPLHGLLALGCAKIRAGEAAGIGASIAHQAFGAIGFTQEHMLHLYTKRLWSWRDEFGNEAFWSRRIGEDMVAAGKDALWPALTAG
jgi:acyl-CoA dehydrogenase